MKNYVVTNAYLNTEAFVNLKKSLSAAFEKAGEKAIFLGNDEAYSLCERKGGNNPILFFDKDIPLCRLLEKQGYRSINSAKVIETCDDKVKTFACLCGDFPMPKTVLAPFTYSNVGYTDYNFIARTEEKLSYPIVVKDGQGSFGKQVFLAKNRDELVASLKSLAGRPIVLQEYIAESAGRDLRVYVVGGKAVACAERINENDFRSNVQSGGHMKPVDFSDEKHADYTALAERVSAYIGADFAGVDLLFSKRGPLVCEINSNAHFSALSAATGVDVAYEIVKYYLSLKS